MTLYPEDFAARLDRSFGMEPPHADLADDLRLGRRRLLRRRASTSLAALAAIAVVAGGTNMLPTSGSERTVGPAAGGEGVLRHSSDDEIVATCLRKENVVASAGDNRPEPEPERLLGDARLMTSAVIANRVEATLLSEDGTRWAECQFATAPDANVKNAKGIYPTNVTFPVTKVAGMDAYEPASEADPRLEGTLTPPVPQFEVPCVGKELEETPARYAEDAACPRFTMYWNDRRPAEVAAVEVVTPDGMSSWADVRRGYLSFAYTGAMTPKIAAEVARGERPAARRVVFYDKDGHVLVDDRDPGHLPQEGSRSIANFPSLAWWLR